MNTEILVTDDDPVALSILSSLLQHEGFQVTTAKSGIECLERLKLFSERDILPSVIFLDVMLPDLSGLEVLEKIRIAFPSIPVIMLSAHPQKDIFDIDTGFSPDYYLEKPFGKIEVMAALEAVIKQ